MKNRENRRRQRIGAKKVIGTINSTRAKRVSACSVVEVDRVLLSECCLSFARCLCFAFYGSALTLLENAVCWWCTSRHGHSVLIPLSKHGKWCTGSKEGAVIPVPGLPFVGGTSLGANQGVLFFARQGGVLCEKFDAFVQENLCMESWDFIIEGVAYEVT